MVLSLDGNSEHVAHVSRKTGIFENKFQIYKYAVDVNKCLELSKLAISLHMCAPTSVLPANVQYHGYEGTMQDSFINHQ